MTLRLLIVAAAVCGLASATALTVSLDTSGLIGHPAGPFSLDFQLTDGSGTGDANNTFTLTDFLFDSGGASGLPSLTGGATGDTSTGVTLTDSSFLSEFTQAFVPGASLSFTLQFTTNVDGGGTPDEFAFEILDSTGTALPSTSFATLGFDSQLVMDIDSSNPTIQLFATDNTISPAGGGDPISLDAPVTSAGPGGPPNPTPEPGTASLIGAGIALTCAWKNRALLRVLSWESFRSGAPRH
ncbi:MAG TPA: hypothetical protein VKU19_32915 [Bryobacteraceae bacterium]|nr:hypothetical protein [Bryobacteraceae bacterium]